MDFFKPFELSVVKLNKRINMKKIISLSLAIVFVMAFTYMSSAQQFIVRVRPSAPAIVRIASPGPRHIWIDGDWIWRGNNYVYQPGYWYLPRAREHWMPGHWKATRGGGVWIPGHWKYRRG